MPGRAMHQYPWAQRKVFPLQPVECVASVQPEIGVSGQHQPALEEERIGVFKATCQQQQVGRSAAHLRLRGISYDDKTAFAEAE